ncbi:MAG: ABC-type transport auxiliary lipoprotein family protein [Pseudomonadota bacterium]
MRRAATAAALALSLAGCASVFGGDATTTIYDLDIPDVGRTGLSAIVAVPSASAIRVLETDRIAVRPTPGTYAFYPNATWTDALPSLVQARAVQAFENASALSTVARSSDGLAARYQLLLDIRAFELRSGPPEIARVAISAKLLSLSSGRVVAAQIVEADVPAASDEADDAVAAMNTAFEDAMRDVVAWAGRRI